MSFGLKKFEQATASMLNYLASNSDLTYFGVGGTARSMVEAVAMEVEQIYLRVYSGLIDAQSDMLFSAFDFGLNPAREATGYVTFYNDVDNGLDNIIPVGTSIQTEATQNKDAEVFVTQETKYILGSTKISGEQFFYSNEIYSDFETRFVTAISSISGFMGGAGHTFIQGTDYELDNTYDPNRSFIHWIGDKPDFNSLVTIAYTPRSVDVLVKAELPGASGNISSGEAVKFLTPVPDVDNVNNFSAFTNGSEAETSAERKARFTDYIETLHKGDIGAIYAACKSVDGVYDVLLRENSPLAGNVAVYVTNNQGTADSVLLSEVKEAADNAKAAGITISTQSASLVTIDVKCKLTLTPGATKSAIIDTVQTVIQDYLSKFGFKGNDFPYKLYNTDLESVIKAVDTNIIDADITLRKTGGSYAKYDLFEDETQIFDESMSVPGTSPYKATPAYTIKKNSPSSVSVWSAEKQTGFPLEEVDTTPQLNQFKVHYIEDGGNGQIEFNSAQQAETSTVRLFYNRYQNTNVGEIFRAGNVSVIAV